MAILFSNDYYRAIQCETGNDIARNSFYSSTLEYMKWKNTYNYLGTYNHVVMSMH